MKNMKNMQSIGVELPEQRKYDNIPMECKNKYKTFQIGHHFLSAVQR